MINVRYKVDYSQGVYGSINEVFERHDEMIRGVATMIEVFEENYGQREYLVGFSDIGAWEARGMAEELLQELEADGWPVEMEREEK